MRTLAWTRTVLTLAAAAALCATTAEATLARDAGDPLRGRQYGLDRIAAPRAWDVTTGSGAVTVAVIDDGVDPLQRDLQPNLVAGRDFGDGDADPTEAESNHGSQTASLIGAAGDNGVGMTGVAWDVALMPLKVRRNGPGERFDLITPEAVAAAFRFAGAQGARVANASFGFRPTVSAAALDEVRAALAASPNTLFVVSAGNNGRDNDAAPRYPCNLDAPNLLCVAASDAADGLWPGSNYGATSVDLAAPGAQVLTVTGRDAWGTVDGTSYAAPLVTGVAALYFSRYPWATVADVRRALVSGVDRGPAFAGKVASGGRLDAAATLAVAPAAPDPGATPPGGTPPTPPPVTPGGTPQTTPGGTPPASAPADGATPTPSGPAVGTPGTPSGESPTAPRTPAPARVSVRVDAPQRLARVLRDGLAVSLRAPAAATVRITVGLSRTDARRLRLPARVGQRRIAVRRGSTTVRVRLSRTAVRRLRDRRDVTLRVALDVSGKQVRATVVRRSVRVFGSVLTVRP